MFDPCSGTAGRSLAFHSQRIAGNLQPSLDRLNRLDVNLVGNTDDTARRAGTSVASLQGLLVATLAKVISTGVDDDGSLYRDGQRVLLIGWRKEEKGRGEGGGQGDWWWTYANDRLGANQLDELVLDTALGIALSIGLNVAQVTDVADLVDAVTMGLVVRVD